MKYVKSVKEVFCSFAVMLAVTLGFVSGCVEKFSDLEGEGFLSLSFGRDYKILTKAGLQLPDTCDFRLVVKQSTGEVVYDGRYGDSPEKIKVRSGKCSVSILSGAFDAPAFDLPQFGDEQSVMVPSDGVVSVRLLCKQLNCGVRLKIAKEFLTACPESVLFLRSSERRLMYGYLEKRFAYFLPGNISVVMLTGNVEKTLLSRTMFSGEMLTINVNAGPSTGGSSSGGCATVQEGITVSVDTSRIWNNVSCQVGRPGSGSDGNSGSGNVGNGPMPENAVTISEAKAMIGAKGIWVSGYVVGGNLTSSGAKYELPFTSRTNFLLGPRSVIDSRSSGMSVNLPSGNIRDALNLVDHPSLLRKKILVKGDVVAAYYGLPGLKNVTDFRIL